MKQFVSGTYQFVRAQVWNMAHRLHVGAKVIASLIINLLGGFSVTFVNTYTIECWKADGTLRWREECRNLVVTSGLDYLLNVAFRATTQSASWFVGLVDGATTPTYAAADTMASHAGWSEWNSGYSGARPGITWNGAPSGSPRTISNSSSKASFAITGSGTIAGAFVVDNSTRGGTTGTLFGAVNFTGGNRPVVNTDTLNVQTDISQQ